MLDSRAESRLRKAVAYFLFIESKDQPDEKAALLRAAALALVNKPVDFELLAQAGRRRSNDDPLYSADIDVQPRLADVWARSEVLTCTSDGV